jgi:CheY-like chemotaxis protein
MHCNTVLIIEDDRSIRETLKITLEVEGFSVHVASNGQEGLALAKQIPRPCLILLDLMMPVMNGFEFLSLREKDVAIAHIPVVIVSAFPAEMTDLSAQGFVKKPINLDLLLKFVEHYCVERKSSS